MNPASARGVSAYLFSKLERAYYRRQFQLDDAALTVVGIPRHDPAWIRTIVEKSGDTPLEPDPGYVLVISRPGNAGYFPRERKRRALEAIRQVVIGELKLKVMVKLHPKENREGLFSEVFGPRDLGRTWAYSTLHPFVLGRNCCFALTFYSGVAVDMVAIGTPVIELLDLRGIPEYDNPRSLRDDCGEAVFSYRYLGLVLGATDAAALRSCAGEVVANRSAVVDRLVGRYRDLFPDPGNARAAVSRDIQRSLEHRCADLAQNARGINS